MELAMYQIFTAVVLVGVIAFFLRLLTRDVNTMSCLIDIIKSQQGTINMLTVGEHGGESDPGELIAEETAQE